MPPLLVRFDAAFKAAKLAFTSGRGLDYGRDWEYTPKLWGPGYRGNWGLAGDYDPEKAAGILAFNSIVQACTAWMQRTYPEPRLKVERRQVDEWKEVHGHPLTRLLARPNPFYAGGQLWQRTLADWVPTGNAYWVKIRDGTGKPIQLWHRPECTFRPDWPKDRDDIFVSEYLQKGKEGKETPWPVEDVVHFRFGYDPANERLGWSPLRAGLNEIGALNTGGRYRGGLLFNKGMPAHSLTPTDPETARELMGKEQSWFDGIRARFNQLFGGSGAGGLFIPSFAAKLERVGFSPAELDIISMLGWDADIVCALLGLNSMVVNLPSGAGQRTYANQADAREAAFECNIIPCQGANAEDLTLQLLPDFEPDPENFRVAWDYSKVRVLQGDVNRERTIHLIAQKQRVLTTTEARSLGWSLQPLDDEQKAEIEGESALPSVALSGTVPGQEAPGGAPPGSLPAGGVPPALPESTGDRRAASQGQPFSRNGALRQAQGAGKALKAGHAGYVVPEIDPGEIAAAEFAGLDAWFEARRERWKGEVGSEE